MKRTAIVSRIRGLTQQPVRTDQELRVWCADALELKSWLLESDAASFVPHFVWHYLEDAEIRFRDPDYRKDQERSLERVLAEFGA